MNANKKYLRFERASFADKAPFNEPISNMLCMDHNIEKIANKPAVHASDKSHEESLHWVKCTLHKNNVVLCCKNIMAFGQENQ